jgi:hypothetical protein
MQEAPTARETLLEAMRNCNQTAGMTVLQHGEMVRDYYRDLISHLRDRRPLQYNWRLPSWINDPALIQGLPDVEIMAEYHLFHDCGKPSCRIVDEEGRQHFPDHAAVSEAAWLAIGGSREVGTLIGMDMDVHLLKGDEVETFARRPQALALLLTALSEVHANASMFGGIDSVSFKIKWKHLEKRGKAILRSLPVMA